MSSSSASKRSAMTLYATENDPYSHRCRIVLAEKAITADYINISLDARPETLIEVNPYGTVPTLLDRDLVLYESSLIMEYLDERFPHPPLMPVYPVARARSRLMMFRIDKDWYSLMEGILQRKKNVAALRNQLADSLTAIAPVFRGSQFFLSEEYSLVDCCLSVLLWRLPILGVELGKQATPLIEYSKRMFDRTSFQASLTDTERKLEAI